MASAASNCPNGVGQSPLSHQRRAQVVVGVGGGGVFLQRLPVLTNGFVRAAGAGQRVAQIVVRFGVSSA